MRDIVCPGNIFSSIHTHSQKYEQLRKGFRALTACNCAISRRAPASHRKCTHTHTHSTEEPFFDVSPASASPTSWRTRVSNTIMNGGIAHSWARRGCCKANFTFGDDDEHSHRLHTHTHTFTDTNWYVCVCALTWAHSAVTQWPTSTGPRAPPPPPHVAVAPPSPVANRSVRFHWSYITGGEGARSRPTILYAACPSADKASVSRVVVSVAMLPVLHAEPPPPAPPPPRGASAPLLLCSADVGGGPFLAGCFSPTRCVCVSSWLCLSHSPTESMPVPVIALAYVRISSTHSDVQFPTGASRSPRFAQRSDLPDLPLLDALYRPRVCVCMCVQMCKCAKFSNVCWNFRCVLSRSLLFFSVSVAQFNSARRMWVCVRVELFFFSDGRRKMLSFAKCSVY